MGMGTEQTDEPCRVTVSFEGRVQGVGFRFAVADMASRHAVTGFVRNEWDGSVYLEAEGTKTELEAFIEAIYRSHVGAGIRHAHREWKEATAGFSRFEIRYG